MAADKPCPQLEPSLILNDISVSTQFRKKFFKSKKETLRHLQTGCLKMKTIQSMLSAV